MLKKEDDKAPLEVRIEQAKQDVEEKAARLEKVSQFYWEALAGNADQQGREVLRDEKSYAGADLRGAREQLVRLTAELQKFKYGKHLSL